MAIIPLAPDYFENFSVEANPRRTYSSSSNGVISGSVPVFARISPIEKSNFRDSPFQLTTFDEGGFEEWREQWVRNSNSFKPSGSSTPVSASNNFQLAETYLDKVNAQTLDAGRRKKVHVTRFEPSFRVTSDTLRKNVIRNVLYPFYRTSYPALNWAYTNYNTLNFFTGSGIPNSSALIYPAPSSSITGKTPYRPVDAFTFDFYINPRYTAEDRDGNYHAGTIMHMSSSFAVSVVSGSRVNAAGKSSGFRLLLQLSHSADLAPSSVSTDLIDNGTYSNPGTSGFNYHDLVFASTDNSLSLNTWHHVVVRWGTNSVNDGTGSIMIDGVQDSSFVIPSSSIIPQSFGDPQGDPDAIFIGNFYEGQNKAEFSGGSYSTLNLVSQFFNSNAATNEGVTDIAGGSFNSDPPKFAMNHPLNAEIHDVKIFDSYRNEIQIKDSSEEGQESIGSDLLFYVPPFFVQESRQREVLQTPFQSMKTKTDDPFNVALSFGVGGHLLNLENFCREFVKGEYPRLLFLTASTIDISTEWATANEFLFATGSIRKRNLTILPNDNGRFRPKFLLLKTGSLAPSVSGSKESRFVNDFGSKDLSLVSLNQMVPTGSLLPGLVARDAGRGATTPETGSILSAIEGAAPENLGVAPGAVLTILQRTRDPSSNEVVFFDVSNLFYGTQIKEGTFTINDPAITGSGGRVSMTFKDDGRGNLFRADCTGSHATWASVGNIIYEEGLANILTPTIPYFGKESFNLSMRGKQNVHVLEVLVPCETQMVNSSSNPQFKKLKPSDYASDSSDSFVYITGLNLHDNNLNIIAKAVLAQPLVKSESDQFMFRVKLDF